MKPSMKPGKYKVYILLGQDGDFAKIAVATCDCAAGYVALEKYFEVHVSMQLAPTYQHYCML